MSFLTHAVDVLAHTTGGLPGGKIVRYCNRYAFDHDVSIPHATYPFAAPNKRTALLENLECFRPHLQYALIKELASDHQFMRSKDAKKVRTLLEERYSHLAGEEENEEEDEVVQSTLEGEEGPAAPPIALPNTLTPAAPAAPAAPAVPMRPYDIFLSYSHADTEWMNLVREHLVLYDRQGKIRKWWDRVMVPGAEFDQGIRNQLATSDIVLLFVSSSFLASDYCYEVEMQQALRQHREGRSVVVPVIVRACGWKDADFGHLLALPTDGRPLASWEDRDEGAKIVADGVMRLVADLQRRQAA